MKIIRRVIRQIKLQWRWFWADRRFTQIIQGLFLGAAGIIPGMSGSVLAISFGIYDNLMEFLARPFQNLSKNVRFFLPYVLGGIGGWLLLAFVLAALFDNPTSQVLTIYTFLGLMIGSLPAFFKEANVKGGFKKKYLIPMFVTIFVSVGAGLFFENQTGGSIDLDLNWMVNLLSGCLIGLGTIVPGLSASVMLIFVGVYNELMTALTSFDVGVIALVGLGILTAILLWSRLISWMIKKWYGFTYYAFIGLTFGSMLLIWPKLPNGWLALAATALFVAGIIGGYYLNKEQKGKEQQKL